MAFQHSLSTNNYGPAKIVVASSPALGTHTTIALAIADAVSGDTIFLRDGTYTEDFSLKAGVTVTAFTAGPTDRNATGVPAVEIIGEITTTFAGSASISNIRLTNVGSPFLTISGSSATVVSLYNCELVCLDNTGLVNSSSSASSILWVEECYGDLLTTGIAIFSMSSAGLIFFSKTTFNNTGLSTTQNSISAGRCVTRYSQFANPFITSGTTAIIQLEYTAIDTSLLDVTALTHNSTSAGNNRLEFTTFRTSDAISLVTGAGSTIVLRAPVFNTAGGFAHTSIGGTATIVGTENTATSFAADSSSATPTAAGVLTIAGDDGLVTAGSGSTISVGTGSSLTVGSSNSGATNTVTISNSSNTASSNAGFVASVGGSSAGDPTYQATVSGVTTWTWGIDNSVTSPTADPWVLSQGTVLGTNNVMSVATSGEINHPLQPAFLAFLPSSVNNVTGDGTVFTLGTTTALTEVFDQNGDFNTNGTFTAPVTGKYQFNAMALLQGCTIATNMNIRVVTTSRTYTSTSNRAASNADFGCNISVMCNMTAGDTATVAIVSFGEAAATDDLAGNASVYLSGFCGYLVA